MDSTRPERLGPLHDPHHPDDRSRRFIRGRVGDGQPVVSLDAGTSGEFPDFRLLASFRANASDRRIAIAIEIGIKGTSQVKRIRCGVACLYGPLGMEDVAKRAETNLSNLQAQGHHPFRGGDLGDDRLAVILANHEAADRFENLATGRPDERLEVLGRAAGRESQPAEVCPDPFGQAENLAINQSVEFDVIAAIGVGPSPVIARPEQALADEPDLRVFQSSGEGLEPARLEDPAFFLKEEVSIARRPLPPAEVPGADIEPGVRSVEDLDVAMPFREFEIAIDGPVHHDPAVERMTGGNLLDLIEERQEVIGRPGVVMRDDDQEGFHEAFRECEPGFARARPRDFLEADSPETPSVSGAWEQFVVKEPRSRYPGEHSQDGIET